MLETLGYQIGVEYNYLRPIEGHSTEHRADLAAAVTRLGGTPTSLDYVQYLADMEAGADPEAENADDGLAASPGG